MFLLEAEGAGHAAAITRDFANTVALSAVDEKGLAQARGDCTTATGVTATR